MSERKPLVIAFISDIAGAMIGVNKLADGIQGISDASDVSQDAIKSTEAALRALGVRSESVAAKQIAKLEETFAKIRDGGVASADEIARAQEAMESRIAAINASIGVDTQTTWEKIVEIVENGTSSVGQGAVNLVKSAAGAIVQGITIAAGAAAIGVAGGGAANIFDQANRADETIKLARATNTNIEAMSAYSFAAEQSGVDTATLATAMKGLRQNVDEVRAGKADATLTRLGVAIKDADGNSRKFDDVLLDVVGSLANVQDEAVRASLAAEVFGGKAGPGMASFIELGRDGLLDYIETAKKFGLVISEDVALAAESFNDRFDDLGQRLKGIRAQIAQPFFEPFAKAFEKAGEIIDNNKQIFLDFGKVVSEKILSVFEDFLAIIDGREQDVQNTWILGLRDAMVAIYDFGQNLLIPMFQTLLDVINLINAGLDAIFYVASKSGEITGNILNPVDPSAGFAANARAMDFLATEEGKRWQAQKNAAAGTPVTLKIESKSYELSAPADVAKALAEDQNAKAMTRPTNPSRALR